MNVVRLILQSILVVCVCLGTIAMLTGCGGKDTGQESPDQKSNKGD